MADELEFENDSQLLTMGDFQLRINDTNHEIQLPDDQIARLLLVNEDNEVSQGLTNLIHLKMADVKVAVKVLWLHTIHFLHISPLKTFETYPKSLITVVTE